MPSKDDYAVQRARIERLIREMEQSTDIRCDEDRAPTLLRFWVSHSLTGAILIPSFDWHVSEIADKSDDELRALISALSANRLR